MGVEAIGADGRTPHAALPDTKVVIRVKAGDSAVFEKRMRRHQQRIYRVVRAVVKDEADVGDVMTQACNTTCPSTMAAV